MSDIVERLRKGIEWTGPTQDDTGQTENYMDEAADQITALRAEVEDLGNRLHHVHRLWANNEHALRAENERLGRDYNTARDAHDRRVRELDAHCIEITALRAENERLRAALREVMDDLTLISENDWLPVGLLDDVIYVNARAALEEKQ